MPQKKEAKLADDSVARKAYELWQARGGRHGSHDDDWYRAEQDLRGAPKSTNGAGKKATKPRKSDAPKKPKASKPAR